MNWIVAGWHSQDRFFGNIYEYLGFIPTDSVNLARRQQHFVAGEPVSSVDDQVTNDPAPAIHHEIRHEADNFAARLNLVSDDVPCAPQVGVNLF